MIEVYYLQVQWNFLNMATVQTYNNINEVALFLKTSLMQPYSQLALFFNWLLVFN